MVPETDVIVFLLSRTDLIVRSVFRFATGKVTGRHQIPVICRRSHVDYTDRLPGGDGAMTDIPAAAVARRARPGRG
jgi:hypothetical protein